MMLFVTRLCCKFSDKTITNTNKVTIKKRMRLAKHNSYLRTENWRQARELIIDLLHLLRLILTLSEHGSSLIQMLSENKYSSPDISFVSAFLCFLDINVLTVQTNSTISFIKISKQSRCLKFHFSKSLRFMFSWLIINRVTSSLHSTILLLKNPAKFNTYIW